MHYLALTFGVFAILGQSQGADSPQITPVQGGISGDGITTRYWDCCKPSCAWTYETNQSVAVQSCEIDGATPINDQAPSGCGPDGIAYTCNNQQPWVVNDTLSYGFAAASFVGGLDNSKCCHCVLLQFQDQLAGKMLLAQILNTGETLYQNQFDLVIPGGGVGVNHRGCVTQWNTPENGWGEEYGGISTENECDQLPKVLQPGCHWRFTFLEGVSNPSVKFYEVECPAELHAITKCVAL
ncbi:endoglucanase-like [Cylas formicarius]|uniref:endoglucanase-like n=1 Tax=Cylas formicarius TaxID=197179 RepID=UPI0029585D60|nr:endoglucanase-like [Cylas formicarius]